MARNAVLIGINDYSLAKGRHDLKGCINDVDAWAGILTDVYGYSTVGRLVDRDATKPAILDAIRRLCSAAKDGDHLCIQYSGHGTTVADVNGDEDDGRWQGAFSASAIPILRGNPGMSYEDFQAEMAKVLPSTRYRQTPGVWCKPDAMSWPVLGGPPS